MGRMFAAHAGKTSGDYRQVVVDIAGMLGAPIRLESILLIALPSVLVTGLVLIETRTRADCEPDVLDGCK